MSPHSTHATQVTRPDPTLTTSWGRSPVADWLQLLGFPFPFPAWTLGPAWLIAPMSLQGPGGEE